MTALLLNSGTATRMGDILDGKPKCLAPLGEGETILSRQIRLLCANRVDSFVITTGGHDAIIQQYLAGLHPSAKIAYVHNPLYAQTNYIYSMHLVAPYLKGDILLLHGDLVFDETVARQVCGYTGSCMAVSTAAPLPQKDFKAVLHNGMVQQVGVSVFESAVAAQPFYRLAETGRRVWWQEIERFCQAGNTGVYAEDALNRVAAECAIYGLDVGGALCREVDTPEDLEEVKALL